MKEKTIVFLSRSFIMKDVAGCARYVEAQDKTGEKKAKDRW